MNRYLASIIIFLFGACLLHSQVPSGYTWQESVVVDFGAGVNHFTIQGASDKSGGELELRVGAADGPVIGRVFFHFTGSTEYFKTYSCDLTQTLSGVQEVYMNFLDYEDPQAGGHLVVGEYAFEWVDDTIPLEGDLGVYAPVPGLEASPYYEFSVKKVSELDAENLADVTNWESLFAWFTQCRDEDPNGDNKGYYANFGIGGWSHTYTNFELDPNTLVVVKITRKSNTGDDAPSGSISSAAVHPVDNVESMQLIDGSVYVTLKNPTQVTIDIDGQMDTRDLPRNNPTPNTWKDQGAFPYGNRADGVHAVSIFANPFIEDKPNPNAPDVLVVQAGEQWPPADINESYWNTLYFEPGIHRMSTDTNSEGELVERPWQPEDIITLEGNKSYYIPGDAIVYGNFTDHFSTTSSDNIRVFGHGTISGTKIVHFGSHPDFPKSEYPDGMPNSDRQRSLYLGWSESSVYEGVTVADPANHSITMSGTGNDSATANYVKWVKVIAWRTNSDAISVTGNTIAEDLFLRAQDDGHYVSGTTMRRVIMWIDVNGLPFRSSFITRDGDAIALLEDIDIIYARGTVFGRGGMMSNLGSEVAGLEYGVSNTGQGVHFRNITVSDPRPQVSFITLIPEDMRWGDLAGVRFENVNIHNKSVFGVQNELLGHPNASFHDWVFDNVVIAGERVDANYFYDPSNFETSYVYDQTFRQTYTIEPNGFTLTTTATNGSIEVVPAGEGSSEVMVTATPLSGYSFSSWSGDLSSLNPSTSITVDSNQSITANFEATIPGRIEVENFDAHVGIQKEACSEGGENITAIDDGDWVEYEVAVSEPGDFRVDLRVAALFDGGSVSFYSEGDLISTVAIPATGGHQVWSTIRTEMNLDRGGSQTLRLSFSSPSGSLFNLNWVDFSYLGVTASPVPGLIEAESQVSMARGVRINGFGSGAPFLAWIHNGRWAEYDILVTEAGTYPLDFRVASEKSGGSIRVLVDGISIGTVSIPDTGNSDNYTIATLDDVTFATEGRKKLRLEFEGNGEFLYRLDWLRVRGPIEIPGRIDAVEYSSQSGIQTEPSNEGGRNIGFINDGDWAEYLVNVRQAGIYTVDFRVASGGNGGRIDVVNGGSVIGSADVTLTNGWYNWYNVSTEVILEQTGPQILRLNFNSTGTWFLYNVNWVEFTRTGTAGVQIEDRPTMALLEGGETHQLSSMVSLPQSYDPTVIWSSSDASVAVVTSSGLITTGSSGEVTLTASVGGGTYSDQFVISVMEPEALLASLFPDLRMSMQSEGNQEYLTLSYMRKSGGNMSNERYIIGAHTFIVEGSIDLVNWDEVVETVSNPEGLPATPSGYEWASYRISQAIENADNTDRAFMRVRLLDATAP